MALFGKSDRQGGAAARPVAHALVREVHTTLWHLFVYVGLFVALGVGTMKFLDGPYLDKAADKLLAATAYQPPPDWIEAAKAPKLRAGD
jgi:hypothetical protein